MEMGGGTAAVVKGDGDCKDVSSSFNVLLARQSFF